MNSISSTTEKTIDYVVLGNAIKVGPSNTYDDGLSYNITISAEDLGLTGLPHTAVMEYEFFNEACLYADIFLGFNTSNAHIVELHSK